MKTITTVLLLLMTLTGIAQDATFVHTVTPGNTSGDLSLIDHPLLNNNPTAQLVVSHVWNPPGSSGVYNTHRTGLYYDATENKWGVYNEDANNIVNGSSYFVYVEQNSEVYQHVTSLSNQGTSDAYTVLSHPDLNGNPEAQVVVSTYYNPNASRNDKNYGTWYDGTNWNLFTEGGATIEIGDAFMVAVNGGDLTHRYRHVASAASISGNVTIIDHPALNGNPDARFVFMHNWGETGTSANVIVDKVLGVWYTGTNWSIYTEDISAFPEDSEYDLIIFDPTLGVSENGSLASVSLYPNPADTYTTIESQEIIEEVRVYNLLGQEVLRIAGEGMKMSLDTSSLTSGTYLVNVRCEGRSKTLQLLKK